MCVKSVKQLYNQVQQKVAIEELAKTTMTNEQVDEWLSRSAEAQS